MNNNTEEDTSLTPPLRVRTLELLWHCNERNEEAEMLGMQTNLMEGITSIDLSHKTGRVVTTGGDGNIRIWSFNEDSLHAWLQDATADMSSCCTHICSVRPSWMPVNARWSPQGNMIASSHCDGKICLWWKDCNETSSETWKDFRHLSGHIHDAYDVCFSPDSKYLLSAGSDGSVVLHDVDASSYPLVQLTEVHSKFCRGVSWDPWNRYVNSFGAGPALLCYTHIPRKENRRSPLLVNKKKCEGNYIGESCSLSFRRPSWSPDGTLLAVPYGKIPEESKKASVNSIFDAIDAKAKDQGAFVTENKVESEESSGSEESEEEVEGEWHHCINLYARNALEKVAGRLVVRGLYEIRGVRWAPCFLEPLGDEKKVDDEGAIFRSSLQLNTPAGKCSENSPEETGAWGPADYRMALAAWTSDAVIVFTTDSSVRHSDFTDLHMRSITDIAWSANAKYLYTASLDGYISVISFGDSLSVAHRLPTFSPEPLTLRLCEMLSRMDEESIAVEEARVPKEMEETKSVENVAVVAVVKKKKKMDPASEVNLEQLEMLTAEL